MRPNLIKGTIEHEKVERVSPDIDRYDYILCGHVHDRWTNVGKNVNVGTDVWDFKPQLLENILIRARRGYP